TGGLALGIAILFWLSFKINQRVLAVIGLLAVAAVAVFRMHLPHSGNPAKAPNVVLIVLDTVRADHLGCYGYSQKTTPYIDELASKGVRFDQMITPSPWTAPSHAAIFTGLFPAQNQ